MDSLRGIEAFIKLRCPEIIRRSIEEPTNLDALIAKLSLATEGSFETIYAPFEHVNTEARITIIGLTPGQMQMRIALEETRRALRSNVPWTQAVEHAKYAASFGGPMRSNLVRMLDYIGLNKWLQVDSCASLFSTHRELAHHTSVLRYPVLKSGKNYSGQPPIARTPFLKAQVDLWFSDEFSQLPQSVFVPLGAEAQAVLAKLISDNRIPDSRTLIGVPHPSGANAERIAYFLARKGKNDLSAQTDADAIDFARSNLLAKVAALS
jgi:uracil-DNA glycosylase